MLHFHKISSLLRLLGLGLAIITVVHATQTFKELEVLTPAQKVSLERVSKTAHFDIRACQFAKFQQCLFSVEKCSKFHPPTRLHEGGYLSRKVSKM